MFNCSCCGTEVTSPYFFNGGVYGWTCIKKVNQNAKRNKPKTKFAEVEVLKVVFESDLMSRGKAYVSINGEKSIVPAYREYIAENNSFNDFVEIANYKFYNGKFYATL